MIEVDIHLQTLAKFLDTGDTGSIAAATAAKKRGGGDLGAFDHIM